MATAKMMWIIVDLIGWPLWLLGIAANIDNGKSIVLFILAAMFILMRMWYYRIEKEQKIRDKEYDLWNKEQDKVDRIAARKIV